MKKLHYLLLFFAVALSYGQNPQNFNNPLNFNNVSEGPTAQKLLCIQPNNRVVWRDINELEYLLPSEQRFSTDIDWIFGNYSFELPGHSIIRMTPEHLQLATADTLDITANGTNARLFITANDDIEGDGSIYMDPTGVIQIGGTNVEVVGDDLSLSTISGKAPVANGTPLVKTINGIAANTAGEVTISVGSTQDLDSVLETGSTASVSTPVDITASNFSFLANSSGGTISFSSETADILMDQFAPGLYITVDDGSTFTATGGSAFQGIQYGVDFSANYTDRSLVDREYVNNAIASSSGTLESVILANGIADAGGNDVEINNANSFVISGPQGTDFVPYEELGEGPNMMFSEVNITGNPDYDEYSIFGLNPGYFNLEVQPTDIDVTLTIDDVQGVHTFTQLEPAEMGMWGITPAITGSVIILNGAELTAQDPSNIYLNLPEDNYSGQRVVAVNTDDGSLWSIPAPAAPLDDVVAAGGTITNKDFRSQGSYGDIRFYTEGTGQFKPNILITDPSNAFPKIEYSNAGVKFTDTGMAVNLIPPVTTSGGLEQTITLPDITGNLLVETEIQTLIDDAVAGAGASWGSITGTITDQTDLVTYVDDALDVALGDKAFTAIDEGGGGVGRVVAGRISANYGNVGNWSFDASYSSSESTTRGVTGVYSGGFGNNLTLSGGYSVGGGQSNSATGAYTAIFGNGNKADAIYSTVVGWSNESLPTASSSFLTGRSNDAESSHSITAGQSNINRSFGGMVLGRFNDAILTSSVGDSWVDGDPVFIVGNGTASGSRGNSYVLYNDGKTVQDGIASYSTDLSDSMTDDNHIPSVLKVQNMIDDMEVVDDTITTAQTADDLNTLYPGVPVKYSIIAPAVGTGMIYKKVTDDGQWIAIEGTLLTPTP